MSEHNLVLFDIDGCLLEPSKERLHAYNMQDWATYHALAEDDPYIPAGMAVYKALAVNPFLRCVFLTDRNERNREYTQKHLNRLGFAGVPLLMRAEDRRFNPQLGFESKLLTLKKHGYSLEEVLLVIEDRQNIVDSWRSMGITCYQTQVTNYPN
jgi:hypothetical protein